METILKVVNERAFVTEYFNYCELFEVNSQNDFLMCLPKTIWKFKSRYECEEPIIKDFGNIFCSVNIDRRTLCLEESDDKLSIKAFYFTKHREKGSKFFRKTSYMKYITFNKKTKNFYFGKVEKYHTKIKRKSVVRCNDFNDNFIHNIINNFKCSNNFELNNSPDIRVLQIFKTFLDKIGINDTFNPNTFINLIYGKNLDDKGVKKPDNYFAFKECFPRPSLKVYKKNKFKMIESFMDINSLKGDKIKRILHKLKLVHFPTINLIINNFGFDFFFQKSDDDIIKVLENIYNEKNKYDWFISQNMDFIKDVTKKEKNNIFNCLLELNEKTSLNIFSLNDHIRFYKKISKYEKIRWNSNNEISFKQEHYIFSEKNEMYSIGYYNREYSNYFKEKIEEEINYGAKIYKPVLLQKYIDYTEESVKQSNCVRTYNNSIKSIIISLRDEEDNRLTIQMVPEKEGNKVIWKNVQTRARFNEMYSDEWIIPLKILEERLSDVKLELPKLYYVDYSGPKEVNVKFDKYIEIESDSNLESNTIDLIQF